MAPCSRQLRAQNGLAQWAPVRPVATSAHLDSRTPRWPPASVITSEFESHDPLIRLDAQNAVRLSPLKDRPLNLARAADRRHAAGARRVSATRIAPTSSQVVTEFQSDSARTDSPVRILYAQPGSPVSTSVWGRSPFPRHVRAAGSAFGGLRTRCLNRSEIVGSAA
jgi:hypothetical protein